MDFEKINFSKHIWRIVKITVGLLLLTGLAVGIYFFTGKTERSPEIEFGLTFSQLFAEEMELDWKGAYLAMLDELQVKKLRLIAYWPKIEPNANEFDFDDLDWQIAEAEKRGAEVILAMGYRLPRWPECHIPEWAKELSEQEREERIKLMLARVVEHYENNPIITMWQVENEPFLKTFGVCPRFNTKFLEEEIALVKRTDNSARPIVLTASGELSSWLQPASRADVLGTSLYRVIWNDTFGRIKYPIPPVFYYKRANFVKWVTGIDKIIIIELQGEPWGPKQIYETPVFIQARSMDVEYFNEIIDYTYQTGFDEAYLWGVEWWYQRKERGNDIMWTNAKKLWR